MKNIFLFFFFTSIFSSEHFLKNILSDESICKTYEILIPDYEHATNPSIIPYKDGYLLSFRYDGRFPQWSRDIIFKSCASFIGLAYLDKQFRVKKKSVQLLEIRSFSDDFSIYAEDARLFVFQERIFLTFNDFPSPSPEYIRQLYLGEITNENGRWIAKKRALPCTLDNMNRIEKNWVPFFLDQSLYFIYGENPHTILECDLSTGHCIKVDERTVEGLDWPYGIIRGGTPAFEVDDQFLTFYHSSLEESDIYDSRIYFMGAYIFDSFFLFTIRAYTPRPIGMTEDYKDTSSKKHSAKKVVFPGGYVRDGNRIHIAWGKDDKMIMITTLDLERLLKSMKKIGASSTN
jgi:predicted GH43/DUF377 family glycosyl hydrolase